MDDNLVYFNANPLAPHFAPRPPEKRLAREEAESYVQWFDKLDDIKTTCPALVAYLQDNGVPKRYVKPACRASCKFFNHQVASWNLAKTIFFIGSLNFNDDNVDKIRRSLRYAELDGKALLRCNSVGRVRLDEERSDEL